MGRTMKVFMAFVAILIGLAMTAEPASAIWQALLDEHFNKDPANPNLRWPWITHRLNNPPRVWGWGHNPRNWPTGQGNRSNISWGIQDFIFNSHILQNEEFHQSIWCAYCTENGPNAPQWPEDDEYWNNANAWAWWGPMDTRNWVGGAVAFWVYMDMGNNFVGDSLSICLTDNVNLVTSNGNDFRRGVGIGRTFINDTRGDWIFRYFYFDSVRVNGELYNMLGRREVYFAAVFQSDVRNIGGTGAYLDDLTISWDDGLFEIYHDRQYLGYVINQDSTHWSPSIPNQGERIRFRCDWKVQGDGEMPPFNIECYLNDSLIYTEERVAIAGLDSTYTSIADTIWEVTPGAHVVRWELDTPTANGGQIVESNERNNVSNFNIDIDYNPAPEFVILTPEELETHVISTRYPIHWAISDTIDDQFSMFIYWSKDTTGFIARPDTLFGYPEENLVYVSFRAPLGEGSTNWNFTQAVTDSLIRPNDELYFLGFTSDGVNTTYAIAPGTMIYSPLSAPLDPIEPLPLEPTLTRAFPNPFNQAMTVEFALPGLDYVKLNVLDMAGRHVANLYDGTAGAGKHTVTWQPSGIPAGVYMLKFDAHGQTQLQKAVYMP
ncbi:MAG: T9SS type A sorting domain-containing protein [Calditrichota bacterium]